jgi:hypothetical protein
MNARAQQVPDAGNDDIRQRSGRQVVAIKERIAAKIAEFGCSDEQVADWTADYVAFAEWKPKDGLSKLRATAVPVRLEDPEELEVLYKLSGYVKNAKGWLNECGRPARLSNLAVDLDADHALEVVVTSIDQVCYGQAGPRNTLFKRGRAGKWVMQLDTQGFLQVGTHRTKAHLDLHFSGSGYCTNDVYSWQKGKYLLKCAAIDRSLAEQCGKSVAEICKMKSE